MSEKGALAVAARRILFALALFVAAYAREGDGVTVDQAVIWFPTGAAVAGLWLWGYGEWWVVALCTVAQRHLLGYDVGVTLSAGAGSAGEALLGAFILRRLGFDAAFARLRDFGALLAAAAVAPFGSIVASVFGRTYFWVNPSMPFNSGWGGWWRMNALGALAIVPPAVTWLAAGAEAPRGRQALLAGLGAAATALAVFGVVNAVPVSVTGILLLVAVLPVSLYAGIRLGPREAATIGSVAAVVVALATVYGHGPFLAVAPRERHSAVQVFELLLLTVPLVLGVLVAEREAARASGARSEEQRRSTQLALPDITYRIRRDLVCLDLFVPEGASAPILREAIVGRSLRDLFVPATAELFSRTIDQVLSAGPPATIDYPLVVEGRRRIREARCVRYGPDEVLAVVRDVTERMTVQHATAFEARVLGLAAAGRPVSEVFDAIVLGMEELTEAFCSIVLLEEGRMRVAAAPSLPASFRDAVEGQPAALGPPPAGATENPLGARLARVALAPGLAGCWSAEILGSSGEVTGAFAIHLPAGRAPEPGDRALGERAAALAGIALQRERATEALRRLNEELEARVAARTEELTEANRELEAFSYSISHELRTPLRAIDGHAALLSRSHAGVLDEEASRRFGELRWNAQRMGRLIDDLLGFARAGRSDLVPVPIDMAAAAREALGHVADAATLARISISIDAIPPAHGDPALLHRVWENLLSNAVKFSSVRDAPEIRVEGKVEGGEAVYTVHDNGVGFDMKYAGKLFGVFHRLHGLREFEGTGVGLALVRRIVLRHGGRAWAEAEPGRGAAFSFSLPAAV